MKTWKEYFLAELVLWLEKLDLELVVEVVDGVEDDEVEENFNLEVAEKNEPDRADAEQKHSELEAEHVENEKESHNPEENFEEL